MVWLLLDLHTDFSGGRSGGLVFPFLKNFPVCCDQHSQKFSIVNKVEVDVFLEFSSFFYDPTDIGNLISDSSVFSKSSLSIWKFWVHELLKPSSKDFEYYLAILCEMSVIVW